MFQLNGFGYKSTYPKKIEINRPGGLPHYVFVYFRTPCTYVTEKEHIPCNNHFILLEPGTPHQYYSQHAPHVDDWIHFEADAKGAQLIADLQISLNKPVLFESYGTCSSLVSQLQSLDYCPSHWRRKMISAVLSALLFNLSGSSGKSNAETHKYYPVFHKIRTYIYQKPEECHQVAEMAAAAGLSISRFQHLYKDMFRQTPGTDIALSRLERAKFLLESSRLSISAIAENSGYTNETHMIRHFHKYLDTTPARYRKNFR